MGDVDARVHIYTAMALRRGRVASLHSVALTPGESPSILILKEVEWTP